MKRKENLSILGPDYAIKNYLYILGKDYANKNYLYILGPDYANKIYSYILDGHVVCILRPGPWNVWSQTLRHVSLEQRLMMRRGGD